MRTFTNSPPLKKVIIIGLGRTGKSTEAFLRNNGVTVLTWDDNSENALGNLHTAPWPTLDACILSPGIPLTHPRHPAVELSSQHNIPIISDIDVYLTTSSHETFGITGTVAKSTTTMFLAQYYNSQGIKSEPAGNFGASPLSLDPDTLPVLELSSAQLERMHIPKLSYGAVISLLEDHILFHGSVTKYHQAKMRIAQLVKPSGVFSMVIDNIPPHIAIPKNTVTITQNPKQKAHIIATPTEIYDCRTHQSIPITIPHHIRHISALPTACALAYIADHHKGIPTPEIEKFLAQTLKHTKPLPHRCELVINTSNLTVINDSKSTNSFAAAHALSLFKNILWIVGGQRKSAFKCTPLLKQNLKNVIHTFVIGKEPSLFTNELHNHTPLTVSSTLDQAITDIANFRQENPKDHYTILLSPAATSWDQFSDFNQRGETFKSLVLEEKW